MQDQSMQMKVKKTLFFFLSFFLFKKEKNTEVTWEGN